MILMTEKNLVLKKEKLTVSESAGFSPMPENRFRHLVKKGTFDSVVEDGILYIYHLNILGRKIMAHRDTLDRLIVNSKAGFRFKFVGDCLVRVKETDK